jgi:hypothetical protein
LHQRTPASASQHQDEPSPGATELSKPTAELIVITRPTYV